MMQPGSPSQEYCCPNPDNSVIPEDNETRLPRKKLRWLYYGQFVHMVFFFIVMQGNPFVLINQLFLLWMLYLSWATMHFCQTMMVGIFVGIDLLQVFALVMKFGSLLTLKGWLVLILFGYDIIAVTWVCQAYSLFTKKFDTMHGGGMQQQSYMLQRPA